MELSKILTQYPEFQNWALDKKMESKELDILTEISESKTLNPVLNWIVQYSPSHSLGFQILELSGELLLLNHDLTSLFKTENNPRVLIQKLKELRYPIASSKLKKEFTKPVLKKQQSSFTKTVDLLKKFI